jgi:hypothetical protein
MNRLRPFLERFSGGHRPPTGPLTTEETADAEELRQETLAKNKPTDHEPEASNQADREV